MNHSHFAPAVFRHGFASLLAVCLAFSFAASFFFAAPAVAQSPAPAPAYTWGNVAIGGGGFVSSIVPSTTQPGLVYARTDVGGAYRWEAGQ